jgi:chromosome segregation ATPase
MDINTLYAFLTALVVSLSPRIIEYFVSKNKSNADVALTQRQSDLIEADIVSKFQTITEKTADENMVLRDRVSKLEQEVYDLRRLLETTRQEIVKYQRQAIEAEERAQSLCAELESLRKNVV